MDIESNASVTLTSSPVIGTAPTSAGFLTCPGNPTKADNQGVLLNGPISMEFDNGTVQCISGYGFLLQPTTLGVPSLTLNGTTIQNTMDRCRGIRRNRDARELDDSIQRQRRAAE